MAMMPIAAFHHQPPGKPSPKSMLQDLTPESVGKKIEHPPFSVDCSDPNLRDRMYGCLFKVFISSRAKG